MLLTLGPSVPFYSRNRSDSLPDNSSKQNQASRGYLDRNSKPVTIKELSMLTQEMTKEWSNQPVLNRGIYDPHFQEEIGNDSDHRLAIMSNISNSLFCAREPTFISSTITNKAINNTMHPSSSPQMPPYFLVGNEQFSSFNLSPTISYSNNPTTDKLSPYSPPANGFLCYSPVKKLNYNFALPISKENIQYPNILPRVKAVQKQTQKQTMKRFPKQFGNPLFNLELIHDNLWELFSKNKNEMIITRFGRCLFPSLRFKLTVNQHHKANCISLNSNEEQFIAFGLQLIKTSNEKLKFRQGAWISNDNHKQNILQEHLMGIQTSTTSVPSSNSQGTYWHPSGVQPLSFWAKFGLAFLDAKLTNGRKSSASTSNLLKYPKSSALESQKNSLIERKYKYPLIAPGSEAPFISCLSGILFQLESFYEYTPMIVCKVYSMDKSSPSSSGIPSLKLNNSTEYLFTKCAFIAVTHYQNPAINKLKKQYNPHAKGFMADSNAEVKGFTSDSNTDGVDENAPFNNNGDPKEDYFVEEQDDNGDDINFPFSLDSKMDNKQIFLNKNPSFMDHLPSVNLEEAFSNILSQSSPLPLETQCRECPEIYQFGLTHRIFSNELMVRNLLLDPYVPREDHEAAICLLASWYTQKQHMN